jgi:hypothetical protein
LLPPKEEHRLRVLETIVLRRIFGPKRYDVTGKWRRLHRCEDNIKMDLKEVGWGEWTRLI